MGELTEAVRLASEIGLPTLIVGFCAFYAYKAWPYLANLMKARAEARGELAEREAERNEILRNNSQVIANNTEVLGMIKRFMAESEAAQVDAVEHHEALSAERFQRMQASLDGISDEVGKMRGEHGILLDRVRQN